jgi:hypothetical protein
VVGVSTLRDDIRSLVGAWKYEPGDLYYASRRLGDLLAAHPDCDAVLYAPDAHSPCALKQGHRPVQKALHHITEDGEQFARRD